MRFRKTLVWLVTLALLATAFGAVTAVADSEWLEAVKGTWKPVTDIPAGTSLIAGKSATNGVSGEVWAAKADSPQTVAGMTDGILCSDYNVDPDNWVNPSAQFEVQNGEWAQFTYDMENTYSVEQVFINSVGWWAQRQVWVYLYVSDTLDNLYDNANYVAEVKNTDKTALSFLMKPAAKAVGRYVGLWCYQPDPSKDGSTLNIQNGYNTMYFGEVAVYGAPDDGYEAAAVGRYLPVTAAPEGTSLIAGMTATVGTTGEAWVPSSDSPNSNTGLTDGVLDPDYNIDADGYYANMVHFDLVNGAWGEVTYDLGGTYSVERVLVNSEGWWDQRQVWVQLYVSDTLSNLYETANLAAEVKYTARTTLSFLMKPTEPVEGRYVGFACYNPNPYTTDKTEFDANGGYNKLRLGELAVYGEAVEKPLLTNRGAQVRDPKATDNYALRFSFDLLNSGVAYADDTHADANYTRDLTNAYVEVEGVSYKLKDFGAVVSVNNNYGDALTMEDVDNGMTKAVSAVNLYEVAEGVTTYTAVVVGIPAAHAESIIYAAPYVVYETDEGDVTLYGDVIDRSVSGVLQAIA